MGTVAVRTRALGLWWAVGGSRVVPASSAVTSDNSASLTSWEVLWGGFCCLGWQPTGTFPLMVLVTRAQLSSSSGTQGWGLGSISSGAEGY